VDAILLGVQPKNIEFFSDMSKEVERAAESIASILYKVLSR
jgi:Ni,Fe-hydrogenase maturation factor